MIGRAKALKETSTDPIVLMTAYAVRGLDINTSYTIYRLLNEQKKNGVAVIYVGEDLDVLLELCDRILVLCGGKVSGVIDGRTATKHQVGMMMVLLPGRISPPERTAMPFPFPATTHARCQRMYCQTFP